jgi:hypothetical protein
MGLVVFFVSDYSPYAHSFGYQDRATVIFVQIVYASLMFPYTIFALEPLLLLLAKSRPTAYDKYGNCVPTYLSSTSYLKRYGHLPYIIGVPGSVLDEDMARKRASKAKRRVQDSSTGTMIDPEKGQKDDSDDEPMLSFKMDMSEIDELLKFR